MVEFNFPLQQLEILMFVFTRMISILLFLPIFDNRSIPVIFKIGLSFVLSLLLVPLLNYNSIPINNNELSFLIGLISEILMGMCIGLSIKLLFSGIQMGGQLVGYQMGLAVANVFNPQENSQNSVVAQFKYLLAILVFLSMDAHHWFFRGIYESYQMIPPYAFKFSPSLFEYLMQLSARMFIIAIKLGAPLIVTMLLTSVALGLVARTVPQMNVFFVAMPIKILIGFALLGLILPLLVSFLANLFGDIGQIISAVLTLGVI